ncbi:MAG: ABC transporter ATP-binding protein/permease, partial [Oscillospiraceae bacterium]|nr:ABC transporter ATP-binding protein/permease [Oscillospiraceae bacterium]
VLLSLPTTTTALMSGSLDPQALRDAGIYYLSYGAALFVDFFLLGVARNMAVRNARSKAWGGMTRVRADYYDQHAPGDLTSAVTNDLEAAVSSLVSFITSVIPACYYVVGAMSTIGEYDILLTLSVLVLLPVKWVYMVVVSRWMYKAEAGVYGRIGVLTGYLAERVRNLSLIKYYTNEDEELKNGTIACRDLFQANMEKTKVNCANTGISTGITLLQSIVTIVVGVLLLQSGRIDITQWVAFFLFAAQINTRFMEMIGYWQTLKSAQGMAARVVEIMEAPKEQSEQEARAAASAAPVSKGTESVDFRDVSFSYGEKKALRQVSFSVPAGTATAIVGLCGSGKTTLLNLLERFYETKDGRILLGNGETSRETLSDLRSRFSYVQQDAGVFSGSIREILTYGIRREVGDREMAEAVKNAGAWEFIEKLPGGLDASVSADGVSLSGGQRQRLVLAREFLRNADILLLDEPTSALDAKTAQAVEETIFRLFKGKTILMVTHDLSLLRSMDQIVVMQEGKVKGTGRYQDLMDHCPLFRDMVQAQRMEVEPV